jgi:chromosome segregation protein
MADDPFHLADCFPRRLLGRRLVGGGVVVVAPALPEFVNVLVSRVFLKSLVIKGFKSFADRTVFEFTPGVAVVVGPNGSGKSNFVDAIAWVLGEQGPKTLRGGKMEDVIFAGTPSRSALGRAEVGLTIDNTSGILPIEFTEVTVSRALLRTGESEYAINGSPCRLLDVQELLSDTGVGRELHTIVGQGRLDEVLSARPEERRAYIEEAAGILKHRRRKERAMRKLERVDADVERLGDVIAELRRQIRPLEQQAELAKRAAEIEADLHEARLKLWVLDYRATTDERQEDEALRIAADLERLARAAGDGAQEAERIETELTETSRKGESLLSAEFRMTSLAERAASLARLADERAAHLADLAAREPSAAAPGEDEIAAARSALAEAHAARESAEAEAAQAASDWQRFADVREEAARAREEMVHLHGERAALRGGVHAAEQERRRLMVELEALAGAREARGAELGALRAEIERVHAEESALAARSDEMESTRAGQSAEAESLQEEVRRLELEREMISARLQALEAELERAKDPWPAVAGERGVVGRLRDLVRAEPGYEAAVVAALEPYASALLFSSGGDPLSTLARMKEADVRGLLLRAGGTRARRLPQGVRSVLDVATPVGEAAEAVQALLEGVALAGSLREAMSLSRTHPDIVVVTRDGERVGPDLLVGGVAPPTLDPREALPALRAGLGHLERSLEIARRDAFQARTAETMTSGALGDMIGEMNELDARMTGLAERMAALEREQHASAREETVLSGRLGEVEERLSADEDHLRAVEARLSRAVTVDPPVDAATLTRLERRAAETSLRLGEVTERERARGTHLADLEAKAAAAVAQRAAWEVGRDVWMEGAGQSGVLASSARAAQANAERWAAEARSAREENASRRSMLEEAVGSARREWRSAEEALTEARERSHQVDLRRAERSHRITALVERLRDEHDLVPEEALEAVAATEDEREELTRRSNTAQRRLGLLGRVNPIAMEQFQQLVDRHAFLTEQVGDLRKSRRDLMNLVAEVDRKIVEVFSGAFADVSAEFEHVFARLFPGGEGRLSLVEPDNLLESGVEVESRPGGKRVKRTSLLSGGERALTAIALLFAIFRARPSPFYLLDEVEAALDDVNLHRFLEMVKEFRDRSQIIVVTHQKRTMEVADVLYGISMGPGGVSRVIGERLAEQSELDQSSAAEPW